MATLREYTQLKEHIEGLKQRLQRLESDPQLAKEFELMDELRSLLDQHDMSAVQAFELIDAMYPGTRKKVSDTDNAGMKASLKVYRNPHTGEVVRTHGGNQKTLNRWREQYGKDEVARWREQ